MAKQDEKKTEKVKVKANEEIKEKEQPVWVSVLELALIIAFVIVVLVFFKNTVVYNIVLLLLILTVLIFVHEFGHFITAKKNGVYVYEFALGMGPKVLGFKRKNDPTEYNLRAFPIGGFCQMAGEEGEDDENLPKDKFMCNKGKLARTVILCAGVFMNFVTAFILLFIIGTFYGSTEQRTIIDAIEKDSPAYKSNIQVGDRIIKLNNHKVKTWDQLELVTLLKNKNDYYEYVVEHKDGKTETIRIVPEEYVQYKGKSYKITKEHTKEQIFKENKIDEKNDDVVVSKIIGVSAPKKVRKGVKEGFKYACSKFVSTIKLMYTMIAGLITGNLGLDNLSGPVGMYSVVGKVAKYGLANILFLMAYLSINLGVMNILPFPAFDGGRVVFVLIEAIIGRKVDSKIEGWFHTVGFMLLMALMLYITFKDIIRLF